MTEEYIVLIMEEPWNPAEMSEDQWTGAMHAHRGFAEAVEKAGAKILGGDALRPPSQAVRITPPTGGTPAVFTDGPFADTKEVITGYYKLGVADEAQARELAAQCPTGGWIELYPVMNTEGM